ncbi:ARF GTPase-activating protein GIT2a isoform X2 [Electrophorus electricus]|uniref:ARF GTPase-activating protein GIT2a isoform X2 n=1 Tax=Electrophorus electricus TaxID=8005 RepID=UPI0015CFDCA7|nr:ARF GTPase-activating protein GIT2a isoform X2 [Electrophorus electricus]
MSKRIRNGEVCADCGTSDPQWASVNRAVLICDQCCSVHRSLGRHSSQVRHLTHTAWPPTQLQMVQTLYNNGANSIWEHSLLDPASAMGSRRKTAVYDKLHPNKAEFIKAKYQMLAFVHRIPCRDEDLLAARDLSKQLHSSVRTGNLETTLRLLSLGAHANFFHPEKGTTPLHVAVKAGQVSQAELLGVYGADPGAPDVNGKTPIDYAREVGHMDLAERLVEIQYELTDGLAFYLCGRKPDHRNGQHFIIPQLADSTQDLTELAKAAKKKLQLLSNRLFEELAMDVYDEVDRRETDAVWHTTQTHSALATAAAVPFLPVNPEYSSTRNQGRQKLARFNAHEFATLVVDILSDAWRRQLGNSCAVLKDGLTAKRRSDRSGSDSQDPEQPDYDSVASDEDAPGGRASRAKHLDPDVSDGPVSVREFLEVKGALAASEAKIQQLTKMNTTMSKELRVMQEKCHSLHTENSSLKHQVSTQPHYQGAGGPLVPLPPVVLTRHPCAWVSRSTSMYETSSGLAPFLPKCESPYLEQFPSLQACPTHLRLAGFTGPSSSSSLLSLPSSPSSSWDESAPGWGLTQPERPPRLSTSSPPPALLWSISSTSGDAPYSTRWCLRQSLGCCCHPISKADKKSSVSEGDYDNTVNDSELEHSGVGGKRLQGEEVQSREAEPMPALPTTEEVIQKTEQITKNIQELLRAAQQDQHDRPPEARQSIRRLRHSLGCFSTLMPWADKPNSSLQALGGRGSGTASNPMGPGDPASCFVSWAERIHVAVSSMVALFPQDPGSAAARAALRSLVGGARRLRDECRGACRPDRTDLPADPLLLTQQVIQCAYEIAKAAKQLVSITTKENGY